MNEVQFAYKVRQHLNRGLHELQPETIGRLAAARELGMHKSTLFRKLKKLNLNLPGVDGRSTLPKP